MFGGEPETVTLRLPSHMVGIVIDRFGKDTDIRPLEDGFISARISAAVSGQFFGWVTGLGRGVTILSPTQVRQDYLAYLEQIKTGYDENEIERQKKG